MPEKEEQQLAKRFISIFRGLSFSCVLAIAVLWRLVRWYWSDTTARDLSGFLDRRRDNSSEQRRSRESRPDARSAESSRIRREKHSSAVSEFLPPASEAEMGSWHFGGHRIWQWFHDGALHNGSTPNGYVEFSQHGILRTSMFPGGRGQWQLLENHEMIASFGKCHHYLSLMATSEGHPPVFQVRERRMIDRSPLRGKSKRVTKGRLDTTRRVDAVVEDSEQRG